MLLFTLICGSREGQILCNASVRGQASEFD